MDCIFCKIIKGELPSTKIYEDEFVLAFHSIQPLAPVHVLVIPKIHIDSMNGVMPENSLYISKIFEVVPKIAEDLKLEKGYRVVSNCGPDADQTVFHLHFHILGGRKMSAVLA